MLFGAGRGWGKTRVGAEWIGWQAIKYDKSRWSVVARTIGETRDVCIEGESGLLEVLNRYGVVKSYNRSFSQIILTNGSKIKGLSAEKPDSIRGSQCHGAWCDELSSWVRPDSWDQLQYSMRLGKNLANFANQVIITTTPKPTRFFRSLVDDESIVKVGGTLQENAANLTDSFLKTIINRYAGTRLWRQEGLGELLLDNPGALWTLDQIVRNRVEAVPELEKVVVAVDPATTTNSTSDETGIVVAGRGIDQRGYVLEDASCKLPADGWARLVIRLYHEYHANYVVVEDNQGGDAWEIILRQFEPTLPVQRVHPGAGNGKTVRAQPIAALYAQNRVSHLLRLNAATHVNELDLLEDQMITWVDKESDFSPDRIDALVHAIDALNVGGANPFDNWLDSVIIMCPACNQPNEKNMPKCTSCGHQFEEAKINGPGFPFSTP
jgi:phage terminase large subunit-like protein